MTRKHRQAFAWVGLNFRHWCIKKSMDDQLLIKHKEVGRERQIPS
ncbi:DUF6906 family protein [Salipaludibacillus sp. HK11]